MYGKTDSEKEYFERKEKDSPLTNEESLLREIANNTRSIRMNVLFFFYFIIAGLIGWLFLLAK